MPKLLVIDPQFSFLTPEGELTVPEPDPRLVDILTPDPHDTSWDIFREPVRAAEKGLERLLLPHCMIGGLSPLPHLEETYKALEQLGITRVVLMPSPEPLDEAEPFANDWKPRP